MCVYVVLLYLCLTDAKKFYGISVFVFFFFIYIRQIVLYHDYVELVMLNTGPMRKNNRRRTLRSSGFTSKHIISHSKV